MLITTATPQEVIRWFEEVDTAHEMLCCLIVSNPAHRSILDQLIDNFAGTDCALGPKVGFMLFGDAQVEKFIALERVAGGTIYLPGKLLKPPKHNLRVDRDVWSMRKLFGQYGPKLWDGKEGNRYTVEEDFLPRDLEQNRAYALTELKLRSMHVAEEWIDALGVTRSQIPVLCVLIKHVDPVIISLGEQVDVDTTLRCLSRLADIAERTDEPAARASFWKVEAADRVRRADEIEAAIKKLKGKLIRQLDVLADQIAADNAARSRIAQFVDAGSFQVEACRSLLSTLPTDRIQEHRFHHHSTENIVRTTGKLAYQMECFRNNLPSEPEKRSISEIIEGLNERREQTAALVAELVKGGNAAKTERVVNVFNLADIVVQRTLPFLNLVEKADKFIQWLKGMHTPH